MVLEAVALTLEETLDAPYGMLVKPGFPPGISTRVRVASGVISTYLSLVVPPWGSPVGSVIVTSGTLSVFGSTLSRSISKESPSGFSSTELSSREFNPNNPAILGKPNLPNEGADFAVYHLASSTSPSESSSSNSISSSFLESLKFMSLSMGSLYSWVSILDANPSPFTPPPPSSTP
ncbi:hypothetical protein Tco_1379054 [Tanacetum coccineum]